MTSLLQRAMRRSFDPLNGPWPDPFDLMAQVGSGRPVGGEERSVSTGDLDQIADQVYRRNGPVFALMLVRMMVFSEARFQFRQIRNGRPGDLFGTQALDLLEGPWPNGTTGDLLSRLIQDADLAGNAFFTEIDGRLKRLRPDWVTIITGSQSEPDLYGDALDGELLGYVYNPRGQFGIDDADILLPHQVAHFAPIPDPLFQFRGMSWLTPVLREVEADSAATTHKLNFFRNGATPQVIVSFDQSVTPEQFEKFIKKMDSTHKGAANAYKTLYLGGGADVTVAGKDLRQLDFKATQGAGESRLAAAAGVPPVIVGFSEGLAGSSLNAGNYGQARRRLADGTMRPLWRNAAGSLATLIDVPSASELWYDDRDIAFLRDDRKDVAEIQQKQAMTIRQLVDAGFKASTVVAAVESEDWARLEHTGLFSVQLQPPGTAIPSTNGEVAEEVPA